MSTKECTERELLLVTGCVGLPWSPVAGSVWTVFNQSEYSSPRGEIRTGECERRHGGARAGCRESGEWLESILALGICCQSLGWKKEKEWRERE